VRGGRLATVRGVTMVKSVTIVKRRLRAA